MNNAQAHKAVKVGAWQVAILILTVLLLGALVADTLLDLPLEVHRLIGFVDTAVCVALLLDFFVRLHRAESKIEFLKWGWIDLIASIPALEVLRWGRLVRVLRVIRLLRGARSIYRVLMMAFENRLQGGVASVVLTVFVLVAFTSTAVLICERNADGNIKTAEDAVWWSISTVTTVGYGDKYPVTTEGRVLGMVLMTAGVGMFGGLGGLAAALFLGTRDTRSAEHLEILARLDRLQAAIQAMNQPRPNPKE